MTKFGGNRSWHVEAISLGSVARRRKKKKKKKKETSKIQYPAGYSGRVTKIFPALEFVGCCSTK